MLSTVAHELRAPLTSVTGFTSSLLRRWDRFTDEQKRLMIETIEADADRLTRLITELLDISRLDSDRLNLRLGPVDLQRPCSRHVVRHELAAQPGDVRFELGEAARSTGLPEMWADPTGSSRSSSTSSRTACGTAPARSPVTASTAATAALGPTAPESVVVQVDDEGDGIPADRPGAGLRPVLARTRQREHRLGPLRRPRARRGPRRADRGQRDGDRAGPGSPCACRPALPAALARPG